jgi:hypothetical protein
MARYRPQFGDKLRSLTQPRAGYVFPGPGLVIGRLSIGPALRPELGLEATDIWKLAPGIL